MTKSEFITQLRNKLRGLPEDSVEDGISFYSEMINDKIEDGVSEEEAVSQLGSVDKIAEQITKDVPLTKLAKNRLKPKRKYSPLEITLIAVGSPIWLSLLVSALAVVFSIYVSLWAITVSLWAVCVSVGISGVGCIIYAVAMFISGAVPTGLVTLGAGLACLGFFGVTLYFCKLATEASAALAKAITLGIKKCFIKKGDN